VIRTAVGRIARHARPTAQHSAAAAEGERAAGTMTCQVQAI
jgi:hypothetical protein